MPVRADAPASHPSAARADTSDHAREAQIFTQYLVARECPPMLVDRYTHGASMRRADVGADELAVTRFVVAHPWSLPYLDAAAALTGRGRLLRGRLQLMAAVLETTPEFADDFLPRAAPRLRVIVTLTWCGLAAGFKALIGAPLLIAIQRGGA